MERVPEPELMDSQTQVQAYSEADFAEPHQWFADSLVQWLGRTGENGYAVDLGCGPADITARVALALPDWTLDGIDGGPNMLQWAAANLKRAGVSGRVRLSRHRLPDPALASSKYDLVFSSSLLHHLERPTVLWETVRHVGRVGAAVYVMDLRRPESEERAQEIVETYSGQEPEILKVDFFNSLCAAYTVEEIGDQLESAGLSNLEVLAPTDRHVVVRGQLP